MNREIEFKLYRDGEAVGLERINPETGKWEWTLYVLNPTGKVSWIEGVSSGAPGLVRCLFTGITDRNGVKIYEGDELTIRVPERSTQTHTGDNIPLGSYTEPMEPVIREYTTTVEYRGVGFTVDGDGEFIMWPAISYTLDEAKDGFSGHWFDYRSKESTWTDPEEGDLQYLLGEYKLKSEAELVEYLGVFVTGNIHEREGK